MIMQSLLAAGIAVLWIACIFNMLTGNSYFQLQVYYAVVVIITMQALQKSILKVVAYFNLFNYPVTYGEIKNFIDRPVSDASLTDALHALIANSILYKKNGFYALTPHYTQVERRVAGNAAAATRLKLANKLARFLSWFPFIRGVAVSGSLSKNFAYKGSDIDFFIITAPNRLWVARMFFLSFFYVARLFGIKNWFCLNYFIDTNALEIPEKNIYTAIEIATLMPKQGKELFADFYESNAWVYNYLPNYTPALHSAANDKSIWLKTMIEWMLNKTVGDKLNSLLHRFYKKRWGKMLAKKKFAKNGFQFGSYIAGEHVCKPIPHYFQAKILGRLEDKMKEIDALLTIPQQVAV